MNHVPNVRLKCSDCPIRHRAVCSRCDDTELTILENIKTYRSYSAGEPILWQGDDVEFVASVVKGVATLGKTLEDGRKQLVGLLLPSDFIGRPNRSQAGFDIIAATDVTLCCFARKPFERMIITTPHLSERLIEITMDELDVARDWMLLLGRKTAREKIATFLQVLVNRETLEPEESAPTDFVLPLTREEIANYLGLTLETVSRQISTLKKGGILSFSDRRHFSVLNFAKLKQATGDDGCN